MTLDEGAGHEAGTRGNDPVIHAIFEIRPLSPGTHERDIISLHEIGA